MVYVAATLLVITSVTVVSAAVASQTSRGAVVVRIGVRAVADGRVEFGLPQRHADASWGERVLPARCFFPTTASVRVAR